MPETPKDAYIAFELEKAAEYIKTNCHPQC